MEYFEGWFMSRVWFTSDLHLGHKGVSRFRKEFSSDEEHNEILYDNLATSVGKRDTLFLLGDIAFSREWLYKIDKIACQKKTLVLGNHDMQRGYDVSIYDLIDVYDNIQSLMNYKGCWLSHCPMHPEEIRNRKLNIHGHTHYYNVDYGSTRYYNVCPEHHNWKPVLFSQIKEERVL